MSVLTSLPDETVSKPAEQVSEFGRQTIETIDRVQRQTAGGLHAAASSITKNAREGAKALGDLGESTAATLDEAATYIEKHDLKRAIGDSRQLVRRYPGESLGLAAGVGFLAGIAILRLAQSCGRPSRPAA